MSKKAILVIAGTRYGKLIIISPTEMFQQRNRIYRCKCDCGRYTNVSIANLRHNNTTSCGICIKSAMIGLGKKRIDNTSGYTGVSFIKNRNLYVARIKINQKTIIIGYYALKMDAVRARDEYIIENKLSYRLSTETKEV